ncbi:hypothetical protein D1223_03065 [Henriciella mobilis]|uniref:Uncharacterized protein n=1 Tax=Henriciella mobilis TaxID=2305467 RepID=A0A399RRE4_9PROT|nr:hypothetical protein D1223_03065 [Henriciella mobilis]
MGRAIEPGDAGQANVPVDLEFVFPADACQREVCCRVARDQLLAQRSRQPLGEEPGLPGPAFACKVVSDGAEAVVARQGTDGVQLCWSFMKRANRSNR